MSEKGKHEHGRIFVRWWHSCMCSRAIGCVVLILISKIFAGVWGILGFPPGAHSVVFNWAFFHPPSSPLYFPAPPPFPLMFCSLCCLGLYKSVRGMLLNLLSHMLMHLHVAQYPAVPLDFQAICFAHVGTCNIITWFFNQLFTVSSQTYNKSIFKVL